MSNSVGVSFSSSANGRSGWSSGGIGVLSGVADLKYVNNNPAMGMKLGGGSSGIMPQPLPLHNNASSFARTRFLLRDSWNTSSASGSSNAVRNIGSFRSVNNAGDLLSRQNYACGGDSQTFSSRPGMHGLGMRFGSTSTTCVPSAVYSSTQLNSSVPSATCNVKYVYDSSDFIKFRRDQALNRTYNKVTFGGDSNNATQSVIRGIRI